MKQNKKATSIVEVMITMMILVMGITGVYSIYINSLKFSESIKNRIIAINIAREGIEAMTNIRDTNWMIFGYDKANCWNTMNYNSACLGDSGITTDIGSGTVLNYTIYQDSNDKWILNSGNNTTSNYKDSDYKNDFRVGYDSNGFYTQDSINKELLPIYTREILVSYPEDTNLDGNNDSNDDTMEVTSLVQWKDNSSDAIHKIEMKTILTNWENTD